MWEKFKSQVMAYPWLFGGVALAIIIWVFWPRGGGASSGITDAAVQSQAIAQTAAANAQLMLASEETRRVGLAANAAMAINEQNVAGAAKLAEIEAGAYRYQADTAVKLADIQAGAQGSVLDAILESQESAQKWVIDLEKSAGVVPGDFEAFGFTSAAPTIVKSTSPRHSNPIPPGRVVFQESDYADNDMDGVASSMDRNDSDPSIGAAGSGGGGK